MALREISRKRTTMRFTAPDRRAARKIIADGWATNFTGAVRYALKVASIQTSVPPPYLPRVSHPSDAPLPAEADAPPAGGEAAE